MNRIRFVASLSASLLFGCSSDEKAASHGSPDASPHEDASTGSPHHDASTSADAQHKDVAAPVQLTSVIELKDGRVQGDVDRGTRRFRGIPYAKPPVGDLRWKPPAP